MSVRARSGAAGALTPARAALCGKQTIEMLSALTAAKRNSNAEAAAALDRQ